MSANADPSLRPAVCTSQTWEARYETARNALIPWMAKSVALRGATVLEYGCGTGAVACALGPIVERHIGVDIDAASVAIGTGHVRDRGLSNVTLEHQPLASILDRVAELEGQLDVVLLYAVLEHMTVPERLDLLRLARKIVRPTGHIVVCESPNRLHWWDHHTSQMPFFSMLPEELQLLYCNRSARPDFTSAMVAAQQDGPDAARDAIVRWGRGVSFHEFELVFGDLSRHVVAGGFDIALFAERNLHPEEIALGRFLAQHCPHLAAGWGRYWLDIILTAQPAAEPHPPQMRPWTMEPGWDSVGCRWTRWESIEMFGGRDARLRVNLPAAAASVTCAFVVADQEGALFVTAVDAAGRHGPAHRLPATAPPGHPSYHELRCEPPASALEISLDRAGYVTFVGWLPAT